MSRSPVHKVKLKKNLAVLGLIIAFCGILFVITIIKISGAS